MGKWFVFMRFYRITECRWILFVVKPKSHECTVSGRRNSNRNEVSIRFFAIGWCPGYRLCIENKRNCASFKRILSRSMIKSSSQIRQLRWGRLGSIRIRASLSTESKIHWIKHFCYGSHSCYILHIQIWLNRLSISVSS